MKRSPLFRTSFKNTPLWQWPTSLLPSIFIQVLGYAAGLISSVYSSPIWTLNMADALTLGAYPSTFTYSKDGSAVQEQGLVFTASGNIYDKTFSDTLTSFGNAVSFDYTKDGSAPLGYSVTNTGSTLTANVISDTLTVKPAVQTFSYA